ncbi:hypothetical protein J6590_098154, partial [Homalodisca vitripennis]
MHTSRLLHCCHDTRDTICSGARHTDPQGKAETGPGPFLSAVLLKSITGGQGTKGLRCRVDVRKRRGRMTQSKEYSRYVPSAKDSWNG